MESKDRSADGPGEVEESDSGDSIFFTQKFTPDGASSFRLSRRSIPVDPRCLEPESYSEDEDVPKKGKARLPVYNFPFIIQQKGPKCGSIPPATNGAIHHSAMAGFFHCFSAMWPNGSSGKSLELLPSIDSDEDITPITEDEKSDEEDIKIIDKQLFVHSLHPQIKKSSQLKNKRMETTKPTKRSNTRQYSGETTMLRSTSQNPEVCSNERQSSVDGCDVTLQKDYEDIASSNLPTENQSILQKESVQLSTKVKQCTNLDVQNKNVSIFSQESVDLFEDYTTTCPLPNRSKDKSRRKTNCSRLKEETLQTKLTPASCNNEKQVKQSSVEEETELLEDHSDCAVRKRKKKKRKKIKGDLENAEKHGTLLTPLQTLDSGTFDNIAAVDSCLSIKRKRKRKKQTVRDCEVFGKKTPDDPVINERQGNVDPVNNDNCGTDCIVTQSKKSVRKKKKSCVPIAETVENVPLLPSLSGESCQGEGKLSISTNDTESAEIDQPLQETELGKKVREIRKDNSELGKRLKVTEMPKCNKSKPCGLKKQKPFETIVRIPPDGSKSAATCPNASESSDGKNENKRHSGDGDVVETIETDLQSDTMRRKKQNYMRILGLITPHELSAPSVRKRKRRRKILYDNNDTL